MGESSLFIFILGFCGVYCLVFFLVEVFFFYYFVVFVKLIKFFKIYVLEFEVRERRFRIFLFNFFEVVFCFS